VWIIAAVIILAIISSIANACGSWIPDPR